VIVAAEFVPGWLSVFLGLVMLMIVAAAALTAPWSALRSASQRQHLLLGGLVAVLLLWLLTFQVVEGVWMHLLGVTSLTLIVGWRFAVLGTTLVLAVYLWFQKLPPMTAPLAWLFSVLVPATTTRCLAYLLRRHGFRNLFVYLLGAGFGGGVLTVLVLALLALPVFALMGRHEWVALSLENWVFVLLVMFPEGFINGMLVTAFTVFYPDLVKTFDSDFYLDD